MRQINRNFKNESLIRLILAIIGILSFGFSVSFGWGFILGGIISKESIDLRTKEGTLLLAAITTVMVLVIYLLLDRQAIFGYLLSTISYFILRKLINLYQKNKGGIK